MRGFLSRLWRGCLLALPVCLFASQAGAWDEVTHAHLTEQAIALVKTPALKAFLLSHRNEVLSGSDFPDWGHALKPHGDHLHAEYVDAAWKDLHDPAVRREANYDNLFAHYLGVYAHVVEDRLLDATFKAYADEVGDTGRDDMENGMLGEASRHYLIKDYQDYVPKADLARIYAANAYFGERRLNRDNLEQAMAKGMTAGDVQNRLLKELSFLTAAWAQRQFPFAAANLETAPGAFNDNSRAVASAWEAIWAMMHDRSAPFFVYSVPGMDGQLASLNPASALSRVVVITATRFDIAQIKHVRVIDQNGGEIPVTIAPYLPAHDRDLAFILMPRQPWRAGNTYRLHLERDSDTLDLTLHAPTSPVAFRKAVAGPTPLAFGLWLGAALAGIGGMVYGICDVALVATMAARRQQVQSTGAVWKLLNGACKLIGICLVILALLAVVTDAAPVITFLRHHH